MSYIQQALITLVQIVFGLYLTMLMLRFLFQWVRADFYNPVSQAIVRLTNPPLKFLRRFIPGYAGIDWPCILLLLLVQGLELVMLTLILSGRLPALSALLVLGIAHLLQLCVYIYIVCITVSVVISWINPGAYNPLTVLIYQLTHPLLDRVRRRLPDTGGLDFSPMVVLLAAFLFLSLVVAPLMGWGNALNSMSIRIR
jgi:YggT family protein